MNKDWPLKADEHPLYYHALGGLPEVSLTPTDYEYAAQAIKERDDLEKVNSSISIDHLKVSAECIGLQKELAELTAKLSKGVRVLHIANSADGYCIQGGCITNATLILDEKNL